MKDKAKIQAKELADAITFLRPFIPDAAVISAFRRMAWSGRSMVGQDGIVGAMITGPLAAQAKGITLEGPKMLNFLSAVGGAEIDAKFTDKSLILTGSGSKAVFRFGTADDAKYPIPPWPKKEDFKKVTGTFIGALKFAEFCADASGKSGPFGTVCVADGYAWATDGGRAVRVPISIKTKDPMLIPLKTIRLVGHEDPEKWQLTEMLWFSWKDRHIWTRLVQPPYPNLANVFTKTQAAIKKAPVIEYDPGDMEPALRAVVSAGGDGVEGEIDKGRMTFRCQGELTEVKVTRSTNAKGSATFFANGAKLLAAFSKFNKMVVCEEGMLYFTDDDFKAEHIVMQLVKEAPREHEEEAGDEEIPF